MLTAIDKDAGFAVFRRGRSLCVRIDGTLDLDTARGVCRQLSTDADAVRLRLECSSLHEVDPDAARILARGALRWAQGGDARSVDVLNLDLELQRTLAWHPLQALTDADELVFLDPDQDDVWTAAARPSRH